MNIFKSINCNGKIITFDSPKVMAIINLTPDSFYSGNRYPDENLALNQIEKVVEQGAHIIDLGAYSSRPGAEHISEQEEWKRLEPVLIQTRKKFPDLIISLDTFRSTIAEKAVNHYSVDIINDISGGKMDSQMFKTIGKLHVPYILMHMKGTPQTMQQSTEYSDMLKEIIQSFSLAIRQLTDYGAHDMIIDPGFGFGKNLAQNYELMSRLDEFSLFERPILVGISRKSMIHKLLNISPDEALNGTTVLHTFALLKGASILRVHDVKEAIETINIFNQLQVNQ